MTTHRIAAAIAAAGLLAGALSGCSSATKNDDTAAPPMGAQGLQDKLMKDFAGTVMPPKSVVCKEALESQVGKSATCDVTLADGTGVEAVTTVKHIDGKNVVYEISPALTKDQVAKVVANGSPAMAVSCESGLPGTIGATATCTATVEGVVTKRVVEVDDVNGLQLDTTVRRLWPKEQVQDVLLQKLNAAGQPVETVACTDDVVGKPGTTVECAAVTGSQKRGYVVTLTTIEEDKFDLDYKDAP